MINPVENCFHLSTTLFNDGRATCFSCGAIVSVHRKVIYQPVHVPTGIEQIEQAVLNEKAISIQQGQRFNEQTQKLLDLEYKSKLCVSQLIEKYKEAKVYHAVEESQAFESAIDIVCKAFNIHKPDSMGEK